MTWEERLLHEGELLRTQRVEDFNELREHPGLAAEVVDGVEGVDRVDAAVLEADDEAAEVFSQRHAVGVLPDQDEIRLEGPDHLGAVPHDLHVHHAATHDVSSQVQLGELGLFHSDIKFSIHLLPLEIFGPVRVRVIDHQEDLGFLCHGGCGAGRVIHQPCSCLCGLLHGTGDGAEDAAAGRGRVRGLGWLQMLPLRRGRNWGARGAVRALQVHHVAIGQVCHETTV